MVLRSTVSMFGPLQPGWLSTARASFRNDARRTRPSGRVTAEQQAAPTDSADQLGLVLNSWLALAHAMHAVQAFLARRTLVTLKKIKRLKIIPAIFICGFPGPRRIIQKAPQLANVEEAPAPSLHLCSGPVPAATTPPVHSTLRISAPTTPTPSPRRRSATSWRS
jgi:hypothetical protein